MTHPAPNAWLHRFAVLTAATTFALIGLGGLVTSHGAGLSVPDWPNSYGYNMFWFPPSKWVGGILYEHTHRLLASFVGLLVVALTRWLGGRRARRPLAIVGALELAAGLGILLLWPSQKATGGFLAGIGGVVLAAALVWARSAPAPAPLPALGWLAFALVQVQGLLGGLRVVLLDRDLGIFHAMLAQVFFVLLCVIALLAGKWWQGLASERSTFNIQRPASNAREARAARGTGLRRLFVFATGLIFLQLAIGGTMRQQHAGLAIPDFPLAYGKLWPATDPAAVAHYNALRLDDVAVHSITAFQIVLQMVHRIVAVLILAAVLASAWSAWRKFGRRNPVTKLAVFWLGLIFVQVGLGAATIWTNKAADVATAHVLGGALSLATGAMLCLVSFRVWEPAPETAALSGARVVAADGGSLLVKTAPQQT